MHELAHHWWSLFVNRTDGTLRASHRGWYFNPCELTTAEVSLALEGLQSLGVYAVSEAGFSRWVCLDADTKEGSASLAHLAATLDHRAILFEPSRRGAHLWLLCPPVAWNKARSVGLALARQAGITCEVFPKGPGRNGVRLPLTPHPKTAVIYPAVDPSTGEILENDELLHLRPRPLPAVRVPVVAHDAPSRPTLRGSYDDLVREVERFTRLREYGPERAIGRCPFHDDRRPSFSILGGFWRCWAGCGEGGLAAFRARTNRTERR